MEAPIQGGQADGSDQGCYIESGGGDGDALPPTHGCAQWAGGQAERSSHEQHDVRLRPRVTSGGDILNPQGLSRCPADGEV